MTDCNCYFVTHSMESQLDVFPGNPYDITAKSNISCNEYMSKETSKPRRVIGGPKQNSKAETGQKVTPKLASEVRKEYEATEIICPSCDLTMNNLTELNRHIDEYHIISDDDSSNTNGIFDEEVIKLWIKNKIKIPNVRLNNINNNLLNINDYILTANPSSAEESETGSVSGVASNSASPSSVTNRKHQKKQKELIHKYKQQVFNSIDKRGWKTGHQCYADGCLQYISDNESKYHNNCFKCGRTFCAKHLQASMKLGKLGEYDAKNGVWFQCCLECFQGKPGYYRMGSYKDLTSKFFEVRSRKIEVNKLEHLMLYKRLEAYLSSLVDLYYDYYYGKRSNQLLKLLGFNESRKKLVNKSYWQDEHLFQNCDICLREFNSFIRKHHCRLCGTVVCDINCSKEVPIDFFMSLVKLAKYEDVKEKVKNEKLRTCLNCKPLLFKNRKSDSNELINNLEVLLSIKSKISFLTPKFEESIDKYEKSPDDVGLIKDLETQRSNIMKYLASLEQVAKSLMVQEAVSRNEEQIINGVKVYSLSYIQATTKILKRFQNLLLRNQKAKAVVVTPKLPVGTIKQLREELMILKEQQFLVKQTLEQAKKDRKFDEVVTLTENIKELEDMTLKVQNQLGEDYGF